jgi:glyoxylase-like metal-dependent hydrolase (beta-lactamase superfamily II)
MVFDLGGMVLEAISLGGHTPGSMVFYEQERHILLSGDAIGSGAFWMQLPESLPLSQFLANARLLQKHTASGNLVILPGHSYQSESVLSDAYLQDVIDVTEDILNGKQSGQLKTMLLGGMTLEFKEAARGQMLNYVYDPKKAY